MMFILLLLLLMTPSWVYSDTHTATSCQYSDVNSAYESASSGDTIAIPAGSCDWGASYITLAKTNLVISGNGIGSTIITTSGTPFTTSGVVANGLRVTGIEFISDSNPLIYFGPGTARAGCQNFRVDHCKFTGGYGAINPDSGATGLIDHCTFIDSYPVVVYGDDDNSATFPFTMGTSNAIFIEDNTSTESGTQPHFIASRRGARYVVRYNTITFLGPDTIDAHDVYEGWERCGQYGTECRGTFTFEVYNNKIITSADRVMHFRGGQGLVYNNYISSNCAYCIDMDSYMISNDICTYPCTEGDPIRNTYVWGNKKNCGADMTNCASGTAVDAWPENTPSVIGIQVDVDWFNSQMPGYTAYTYPHPLQSGSAQNSKKTLFRH